MQTYNDAKIRNHFNPTRHTFFLTRETVYENGWHYGRDSITFPGVV